MGLSNQMYLSPFLIPFFSDLSKRGRSVKERFRKAESPGFTGL